MLGSSSVNLPVATCCYSNPLLFPDHSNISAPMIAFPYRKVLAALSAELWADKSYQIMHNATLLMADVEEKS